MSSNPEIVHALLQSFRRQRWQSWLPSYPVEQLLRVYIEPLLMALGWDVQNRYRSSPAKPEVERLDVADLAATRQVCALLLHRPSSWAPPYLVVITRPPLIVHTRRLLAALRATFAESALAIDTLVLTDFTRMRFYTPRPGRPTADLHRWIRQYDLPQRHYMAWWRVLGPSERIGFNPSAFRQYAGKLQILDDSEEDDSDYRDYEPSSAGRSEPASEGYTADDRSEMINEG
jgi:hypothetical protein